MSVSRERVLSTDESKLSKVESREAALEMVSYELADEGGSDDDAFPPSRS